MPRIFLTSSNNYATSSGYLNIPARVRLHQLDNATGSYLSISRTTGFRISNPSDPFDDTRTINFVTSSNVVYPLVLDRADFEKYQHNWISTPNLSGSFGDVNVAGTVRRGLSDQGLLKSIHQGGGFTPFDESRVYLQDTPFYLTGTSPSILPGFRSPLKDKVQINIDLTTSTNAMMSRYVYDGLVNDGGRAEASAPNFYQKNYTGFRYYNFDLRRWEQIGETDPGTGNPYTLRCWDLIDEDPYDKDISSLAPPTWKPNSKKSYQFGMSSHIGYLAKDYEELKSFGYAGIGSPTIAAAAPYTGSYHATASHQLRMSDYIDRPFLLEKAVLNMPIQAIKKNGNTNFIAADWKVEGSNRDIDNYVFFIYRQRNDPAVNPGDIDSPQYCSGSTRFLVMSASMAFYNSKVFNTDVNTEISSSGLPHTPAFTHNWNLEISGSGAAGLTRTFEKSVRLEMTPAVPSAQRGGGSRFPTRNADDEGAQYFPTIVIQDFWAGGTTFPHPGKFAGPSSEKFRDETQGYQDMRANTGVPGNITFDTAGVGTRQNPKPSRNLGWGNTFMGSYGRGMVVSGAQIPWFFYDDDRPIVSKFGKGDLNVTPILPYFPLKGDIVYTSYGGSATQFLGTAMSKDVATSTRSPYLLFPEDNLVFGMDAGISMVPAIGYRYGGSDLLGGLTFSGTYAGQGGYQGHARARDTSASPALIGSIGSAMSSSFMKIRPGKASLTLYGSFIKLGREAQFDSGQNLTSVAIHEDMHYNNTVLDQFQIESRKAYKGSYIDNLVIGNIFRNDGLENVFNDDVSNTVTRYVASSLGSDTQSLPSFYGVSSNTITEDPDGIASWNISLKEGSPRNSFFRGVRLVCEDERSLDSVLPDLTDFASRSGMGITSLPRGIKSAGTRGIVVSLNGNINETVTDIGGVNKKAFPYDTSALRKPYDDVVLVFVPRGLTGGSAPSDSSTHHYSFKQNLRTTSGFANSNPTAVRALLFKNGVKLTFKGGTDASSTSNTFRVSPAYTTGSAGRPNAQAYGAQSFLYGIENISPFKSSAVFRYDTFGQFRDMLEQRKNRTYFDSRLSQVLDSVVECSFVSASDGMTLVSPYSTQSSNMSQFATSSKPYFDGINANRTPLPSPLGISIMLPDGGIRSVFSHAQTITIKT